MNNDKINKLDQFLDEEGKEKKKKKEIINQRDGLIERIDKKYVTEDGKMLLRERYY